MCERFKETMTSDTLKFVYLCLWLFLCFYVGINYLPSYMLEGDVPFACYIITFVFMIGVCIVSPNKERT